MSRSTAAAFLYFARFCCQDIQRHLCERTRTSDALRVEPSRTYTVRRARCNRTRQASPAGAGPVTRVASLSRQMAAVTQSETQNTHVVPRLHLVIRNQVNILIYNRITCIYNGRLLVSLINYLIISHAAISCETDYR